MRADLQKVRLRRLPNRVVRNASRGLLALGARLRSRAKRVQRVVRSVHRARGVRPREGPGEALAVPEEDSADLDSDREELSGVGREDEAQVVRGDL